VAPVLICSGFPGERHFESEESMKKIGFSEEQMVTIVKEVDRGTLAETSKKQSSASRQSDDLF
jgi:hypothetical protein